MATGTLGTTARDYPSRGERIAYNLGFGGAFGAGTSIKVGTVPAGSVLARCATITGTAFNSFTTNNISVGTAASGAQIVAANAIGAVERGSQSVQSGVDLSAEAGVSLEEITAAARESGLRIAGIVSAVKEQSRAATHVVELMDRVRTGVDQIRVAAREQERGNEVVLRNSVAMREVATQVRGTTEEQARGSGRIRESVESVREAVDQINRSLQEQSAACRQAAEQLERVYERTRSNEESSRRMGEAMRGLLKQAETLRSDVQRFRI